MKVKNVNKDVITVFFKGKNVIVQPGDSIEVDDDEGMKCLQQKGCIKDRSIETKIEVKPMEELKELKVETDESRKEDEKILEETKEIPKEKPVIKSKKKKKK